MKIESYLMSNNETLSAVEMFVNDEREKYGRTLEDVSDMEVEDLSDRIRSIDSVIPIDYVRQLEDFRMGFDSEWSIFLLYLPREVCGLIAFTDWD